MLLVFGVQHALLKAGIVPPLSARAGGKIVTSILRYGFIIALLVILLGFAFVFYQTRAEHDPTFQKGELDKKRIDGLIQMATSGFCQSPEKFEVDATTRRDVVIACTKAVAAIVNAVDVPQAKIEDAITR